MPFAYCERCGGELGPPTVFEMVMREQVHEACGYRQRVDRIHFATYLQTVEDNTLTLTERLIEVVKLGGALARQLGDSDKAFAAEIEALGGRLAELEKKVKK